MDKTDEIIQKIEELHDAEQDSSKVLLTQYLNESNGIKSKKIELFKQNFKNQLEFYSQKFEKYDEKYNSELNKYEKYIDEIVNAYNELYINEQLELQEAESNYKIAVINLVKCINKKQSLMEDNQSNLEDIEKYDGEIKEYQFQKEQYEDTIIECEIAIKDCIRDLNNTLNKIFKDYANDLIPTNSGFLEKLLNKIINKFTGSNKFKMYVLDPITKENEKIEKLLPKILNDIDENKIEFVSEIKENKTEIAVSA